MCPSIVLEALLITKIPMSAANILNIRSTLSILSEKMFGFFIDYHLRSIVAEMKKIINLFLEGYFVGTDRFVGRLDLEIRFCYN